MKPLDNAPRSLSPYLNQTTPPTGPPKTASQIQFAPDSSYLLANVKGDAMPNGMPGTNFVYPVTNGKVSTTAVVTQVQNMTGNFGFTFTAPDKVLMSDVVYGGSSLSIGQDFKTVETSRVTGDNATSCWAAHSSELDKGYIVNAGNASFGVVDSKTGSFDGPLEFDPAFMGIFDTVVDGTTAYFLSGIAALGVVDLTCTCGTTLQKLDLSSDFPSRKDWQGLAMYMA